MELTTWFSDDVTYNVVTHRHHHVMSRDVIDYGNQSTQPCIDVLDDSSVGYLASSLTSTLGTSTSSSRYELVTHGQIWTSDVVQRIATLVPLMAVSLLGNAITVVVLTCSKYRKLNSRINIFIINLAIGDLAVCCFTMTTEVSSSMMSFSFHLLSIQ